jgi:transcriptional regulator with XRE-family HTH domain
MSKLAVWLQAELQRRTLTQAQAAVYAGVGQATISDMMNKGHVPKVETLFRLADYFGTSRETVLRLAGHLPPVPTEAEVLAAAGDAEEALVQELVAEFRRVPDEWKQVAIEQVAQFRRLADLRPMRVIGDEEEEWEQGRGSAEEQGDVEMVPSEQAA